MITNLFSSPGTKYDSLTQKIILFNSTFSILFYIFLYTIFTCTEYDIYSLGSYSSWPIMMLILIEETIKISYKYLQGDTSRDLKLTKGRKSVKKIKIKDIFSSLMILLVMFVMIYVIAVLLGAPFLDSYEQTSMFSALIVLLVIYPPIATIGNEATLAAMFGPKTMFLDNLSDMFRQNMFLILFGAWSGAAAVPLDWDRPWQVWPIPCCIGALIGHFTTNVVSLLILVIPACRTFLKKSRKTR